MDSLPLLLDTASGGTGIDPATFWLIVSGLGAAVSALAGMLYKNVRDDLIEARRELEKFREVAPDLAEDVAWLVEQAQANESGADGSDLPWPYRGGPPRRPTKRPRTRR